MSRRGAIESDVSRVSNVWGRVDQVVEGRHEYAQEWKRRTGRKVIGWLCTYVPEEIIYATGMLPVRVSGNHDLQGASEQPYIYGMFCPYCRDTLAAALNGDYSYLDGLVHAYSCMHIRQTYDSWVRHIPLAFNHMLYVPGSFDNRAVFDEMVRRIGDFRRAIEEWSGNAIKESDLADSIATYNRNRQLLDQIYELRKAPKPLILGSEVMKLVLAGMYMDKREHNELLEQILEELPDREPKAVLPRARLLWVSNENDDYGLQRLIEESGGLVVCDDSCIGSRYFRKEVDLTGDAISALVRRYLDRPRCPWKDLGGRKRVEYIEKLVQDYKVDGVVFGALKFCDGHQYDYKGIKTMLDDKGIPSLNLECDLSNPVGQFRTRVEAFVDMLEE